MKDRIKKAKKIVLENLDTGCFDTVRIIRYVESNGVRSIHSIAQSMMFETEHYKGALTKSNNFRAWFSRHLEPEGEYVLEFFLDDEYFGSDLKTVEL